MKKRKRIAIFSENNCFGGINTFVKELFEELRCNDQFNAYLFIPLEGSDDPSSHFSLEYQEYDNVIFFKSRGFFRDTFTVHSLIEKYEIDIVHTQAYRFNLQIKLLNLLKKSVKHLVTIHGVYPFSDRSFFMKIKYWIDYRTHSLHDYTIAVSENTFLKYFFKSGISKQKTNVIYNGIKVTPFKKKINTSKELRIGFLGRLSNEKGINWLCEIMSNVLNENKSVKFIIGGEGDKASDILMVRNLYPNSINYVGLVKDINSFLSKIDVLLITSKTEGFPLVILESFSKTIPVIASNVGGVAELVYDGYNGFIVDYNDTKSMLEKIDVLVNSRYLVSKFGRAGFELVRNEFSSKKMAEHYINVYKAILR